MAKLKRFFVPGPRPDGKLLSDAIGENSYLKMAGFNSRLAMTRGRRPYRLACWLDGMELTVTVGETFPLFGPRALVSLIYADTDPILVLATNGQALRLPFSRVQVREFFEAEIRRDDEAIPMPAPAKAEAA